MKQPKILLLTLIGLLLSVNNVQAKDKKESYNFTRALEEVQKGNKQGAIEYFNKEVTENPHNGYAYMAIAAFHMDNSEYGDARTAAESALKHLPKKDKTSLSQLYPVSYTHLTLPTILRV